MQNDIGPNEQVHKEGLESIKTSETTETVIEDDAITVGYVVDVWTYCYHHIIDESLCIPFLPCNIEHSLISRNALPSPKSTM